MQVLDSVLLVDDDQASNFFHKSLIRKYDLAKEVIDTRDGHEALSFIHHKYYSHLQLPSLVLIDINMPGMDGFELIKELQHSDLLSVKKIPIAVVTSSNKESDKKAIRNLGNYKYVTKPLDGVKFFDILKSEVVPSLFSKEKKKYINEMHMRLEQEMIFLKKQHEFLEERREEIKKYTEEVRNKINNLRKSNDDK